MSLKIQRDLGVWMRGSDLMKGEQRKKRMRIMLENWKGALKRMWFTVRLRLRKKNWRMMRASLPPKMGVLRWVISIKIAIFEWNLVQRILTSKSCTLSLDASDRLHSSKDFGSLYKLLDEP